MLLVYFLMEQFPPNSLPFWLDGALGLFIPRILILIFIYQNLGTNNIWFIAHLVAMFLTYFAGGTRMHRWRQKRSVAQP